MNIDFHAHIYPEDYLKKLEASTGDVRIETDAKGQKWILSMGAKAGPIIPDFFDADVRVDRIKEHRVDMQILSSPHPGVDRFSPAESADMSRIINDGIAKVVRKYPKHFQGIAMLPLIDTKLALKELDRAVLDLGLKGHVHAFQCRRQNRRLGFSSAGLRTRPGIGRADLYSSDHAARCRGDARMAAGDHSRLRIRHCALGDALAYSGILDRFPELNFRHLSPWAPVFHFSPGASTAVTSIRLAVSRPRNRRRNICAIFTATRCRFYQPALAMAYEFYGASRMVLGSDFPLIIGDLPAAVPSIEAMNIPKREKEKILGENVIRLLKLTV